MPSAIAMWDQKITLLPHPTAAGSYIAFTRAYIHRAPDVFSVAMLTSSDGLHLAEQGILWQPQTGHTFYDPHVSIDNSVCPPRYVMSTECVGSSGWASLCLSSSSSPHLPETWYYPSVFVNAITSPARESASTGVSLTDGSKRYVAWTQVRSSALCIALLFTTATPLLRCTTAPEMTIHQVTRTVKALLSSHSTAAATSEPSCLPASQPCKHRHFRFVLRLTTAPPHPPLQDGCRAEALLQRRVGLQQPVRRPPLSPSPPLRGRR